VAVFECCLTCLLKIHYFSFESETLIYNRFRGVILYVESVGAIITVESVGAF
jgi:hypothetical protein